MPRKKPDNEDSKCVLIGSTASAGTPDVNSTAASEPLMNCAFSAILNPLEDAIPGVGASPQGRAHNATGGTEEMEMNTYSS